jgi:hypothetical protein
MRFVAPAPPPPLLPPVPLVPGLLLLLLQAPVSATALAKVIKRLVIFFMMLGLAWIV